MKKAILLAGGNIANIDLVKEYIDENTALICVDRGCNFAIKHNLKISIAIGDFDSIDKEAKITIDNLEIKKLSFNKDKDQTDLQLALDYCIEKEIQEVYLFGALGTRMDHSMANVYFLYKYRDFIENLTIVDNTNIIKLVSGSSEITKKKGYNLSFMIAEGSPIISLEGVKWPLYKHKMILGDSLTISNEIVEDKARVYVEDGYCFQFLSKD